MADVTSPRVKRLLYRSRYTGTKETDVLLGTFAAARLPGMSEAELDQYERLIENSDPDLYTWISGRRPVPPAWDNAVMRMLMNFKVKS